MNPNSFASFQNSLEVIGQMLSKKYDIKVIFEDKFQPRTDGRRIYLPRLGPNADEDLILAMHGFLDHEAVS